jgi:D-serine/D-alanine/glycine transporter
MLLGVLLLFIVPEVMTAFTIISTVSAILVIFTWSTILASYIAYRKARLDLHAQSLYKMPGGVPMAWFVWLAIVCPLTHYRNRFQANTAL